MTVLRAIACDLPQAAFETVYEGATCAEAPSSLRGCRASGCCGKASTHERDRLRRNPLGLSRPDFRQLVEKQLTAQLRAYRLRQGNMSQQQIAVHMGLALATVRGHLDRADQKIDIALRARRGRSVIAQTIAGFRDGFLDIARFLNQTIVQPISDILQVIDRHAGPAAVGVFVLTPTPYPDRVTPLLILLILVGALALRLTGTTTRRRTLPR
ncbi:MAG: hypothetical protein M5T61_21585 [Acidimicrobiia bacterium]|nr:hypothetical protein [Acidimicrobiia bacterium]